MRCIISGMDPKIYLAPMSGVTDLSFRLISRKLGAEHCFFEMVDSNAIVRKHPETDRILKTLKNDFPVSAQLLGEDPSVIFDAAEKLLSFTTISFLDINSACPARKVVKKGAGAALLNNSARLASILKKLSSGLRIPVTVKLRTGFDKRDVGQCVRIAQICQANGASTIFIHGRTYSQGYAGEIDYESIKAVKDALKIPVFGSGNIFNPFMAKKMLDKTGCDGILVARGALGNPWIFKNIKDYLKNGKAPKKTDLSVKKNILRKHLGYIERYKDMLNANRAGFMGKVTMWYLKGLPDAAKTREHIFRMKSYKELLSLIDSIN